MILWRPVGLVEMQLIFEADMRAYPPRLPAQPIFYPVLKEGYATKISHNWNATEAPFAGYVTRCEVADGFAQDYPIRIVGSRDDAELWIPAEDIEQFNAALLDRVSVVMAHYGSRFRGMVPAAGALAGQDAVAQLRTIAAAAHTRALTSCFESPEYRLSVFLHFPFWSTCNPSAMGLGEAELRDVLVALRLCWTGQVPGIDLCDRAECLASENR